MGVKSLGSPMDNVKRRLFGRTAFTLIELMIVVTIIGVLAAIAIPQFADLIRKSREGAAKGSLGSVRSALAIYYADNEGQYPENPNALTISGKYLSPIPTTYVADCHPPVYTILRYMSANSLDCHINPQPYSYLLLDETASPGGVAPGGFNYCQSVDQDSLLFIDCLHTDTKGTVGRPIDRRIRTDYFIVG
jgi:prepilin-type N-terminal cleavage/methylation domain-containing protein